MTLRAIVEAFVIWCGVAREKRNRKYDWGREGGDVPMRSFERDEDEPLDVHSFRARERLAVHEARTAADLGSRVVGQTVIWRRNLLSHRGSKNVTRRWNAA